MISPPATKFVAGLRGRFPGRHTSVPRTSLTACTGSAPGAEAAAEFQKIVEHRGIAVSDPIGGLAFLQLARAYSISGDRTRAKSAYGDFLKLWKGSDPEIPVLEQAKAEYAKAKIAAFLPAWWSVEIQFWILTEKRAALTITIRDSLARDSPVH